MSNPSLILVEAQGVDTLRFSQGNVNEGETLESILDEWPTKDVYHWRMDQDDAHVAKATYISAYLSDTQYDDDFFWLFGPHVMQANAILVMSDAEMKPVPFHCLDCATIWSDFILQRQQSWGRVYHAEFINAYREKQATPEKRLH